MTVAKFIARDCELSTTGIDGRGRSIPSWNVTQRVLAHTDAAFAPAGLRTWSSRDSFNDGPGRTPLGGFYESAHSIDCLRHWAPNGQCYYSDMSHVEVCTAETLHPRQYAAQGIATLRIAEAARRRAELEADSGTRYSLTTSNVDMLDPAIAWGSHDNVAISTALWEDLCGDGRRPAILGFVSSCLAAAIPFFGAGYLLPFRDGTIVYSPSARAHHLSRIRTHSTTRAFRRGLINTRREPHGTGQERLHLVGFDFTLASAALKASFLQCCLAAAENGFSGLILFDPVRALRSWTWNLNIETGRLTGTALLTDGRHVGLPEYMREVTARLLEMCEAGVISEEFAPDAKELLPRIIELTHQAECGALVRCAGQLDWAAKLLCLLDRCKEDGVHLGDAVTRLTDHDFSSTRPDRGLFWRLWDRGLVDPLVDGADVDACLHEGPAESRAWGRGQLIGQFHEFITDVNWSQVELRCEDSRWGRRLRVPLSRLDSLSKAEFQPILDQVTSVSELEERLEEDEGLASEESDPMLEIQNQLAASPSEPAAESTG